jgi:riboflavin synthase
MDGVGIRSARRIGEEKRPSLEVWVQFPKQLRKYLIEKGSVAVDGISLTVNRVKGQIFELCLIPHTQKLTALTGKKVGDMVNLEVDILAKYLRQMVKKP